MEKYIGKIAQSGIAIGNVVKLTNCTFSEEQKCENPQNEIEKLKLAFEYVKSDLQTIVNRQSNENREIAEISLFMLDKKLVSDIEETIKSEQITASSSIYKVCKSRAEKIKCLENENLRSRSVDIMGLAKRLVDKVNGVDTIFEIQPNTIIVAKELSPQELLAFDLSKVVGLITDNGNPTTHVSIIAGNNSLPYIYGINVDTIDSGCNVVVDCLTGCVITNPDDSTLEIAKTHMSDYNKRLKLLQDSECKTTTKIYGNISGLADVQLCLQNKCDGIGLFRSECLFMTDIMLSEDSQYEIYKKVLQNMIDKEVVIRTLDIGSDKQASWLKLPNEINPALGLRGIRVSFAYPDIFRTQLRALLRASIHGNLSIMFPMITSVSQVENIKKLIKNVEDELACQNIDYKMPKLGIMIETPAAALVSQQLAKLVDFFSIGTNDLTQYTLALDRLAVGLEQYYEPHHDSIYKLIEMTIKSAKTAGIKIAICGELASNYDAISRLISIGVDELSVSPNKILDIRNKVSQIECKINNEVTIKNIMIGSPVSGTFVSQEDIPDSVFADGILGKCFAIQPSEGEIYSPCDGVVLNIVQTLHAFTILASNGDKVFVHIGLDTVSLGGDGFNAHISVGDKVSIGQHLMSVDLDKIRAKNLNPMVIVVRQSDL